jgi:hypothetical protein
MKEQKQEMLEDLVSIFDNVLLVIHNESDEFTSQHMCKN